MSGLLREFPRPGDPASEGAMIIWNTPQIMFWHTAKYLRHPSRDKGSLRSAMTALFDFAARSDLVGRRARDLLKNVRIGHEVDPSANRPECIYISQHGGQSAHVHPVGSKQHDQLARMECQIADAERRIARQAILVGKLSSTLWDPAPAIDLLQTMQETLELMQQGKKMVLRDFERQKSA